VRTIVRDGPPLVEARPTVRHKGVVVGIDQSYGGFAVVRYALAEGEHRAVVMPASTQRGVRRLVEVQDWLIAEVAGYVDDVRLIAMEGYSNAAKFGREMSGELAATVRLALWQVFCGDPQGEPVVVAPTSLKKFVTGSGTAKKDDMKLAVYKHYRVEFHDDNLADAYGLARVAAAVVTGESVFAYQRPLVKELRARRRAGDQ